MAGNRTLFDGSRQERGKSGRVFYRKRHAYVHDRHDNFRHRPRMLKRITNPDVTKALANIVWLGLERLTQIAVAIAISGLLARYFGPDVFGKWQYANTLLLVLSPITWVCGAEILVPTIVNRPAGQLGTVLGSAFVLRMGVSADEELKGFLENVLQGRGQTADEIAAAALFLVSDQASAITGQSLNVDGGMAFY